MFKPEWLMDKILYLDRNHSTLGDKLSKLDRLDARKPYLQKAHRRHFMEKLDFLLMLEEPDLDKFLVPLELR